MFIKVETRRKRNELTPQQKAMGETKYPLLEIAKGTWVENPDGLTKEEFIALKNKCNSNILTKNHKKNVKKNK